MEVKIPEEIRIQGNVLYKPSKLLELTKLILILTSISILVYLLLTRYQGPITVVQFAIMGITGGLAVIISMNRQACLVKTLVTVSKSDDKLKFKFNKTERTKEKTVFVENIQELIVISHLKYIKIINKDGLEVFELSLENLGELRLLSNYIIDKTGAYLVSL